jgi:hypothetical protein
MSRVIAIAIGLVAVAAGCHRAPSDGASARASVQRFFAAAEAGDCARLQPLLQQADECENIVRQFQESKTHLVSVDREQPDGRDAATTMIYTTVAFGKHDDHKWIVRARRAGDAWKMRL